MSLRLDPNVPPHKTRVFWLIVALALVVPVGYPIAFGSHGPLWSQIVPSVFTFLMAVCIGWFAVRRLQRGEKPGGRNTFRIVLLILAVIFFILAMIFKRHP
jgi:amino acid permease